MPRGIDEAPCPRFFSEAGGEIVPIAIAEGARELTVRTPIPRLLSVGVGRESPTCYADTGYPICSRFADSTAC